MSPGLLTVPELSGLLMLPDLPDLLKLPDLPGQRKVQIPVRSSRIPPLSATPLDLPWCRPLCRCRRRLLLYLTPALPRRRRLLHLPRFPRLPHQLRKQYLQILGMRAVVRSWRRQTDPGQTRPDRPIRDLQPWFLPAGSRGNCPGRSRPLFLPHGPPECPWKMPGVPEPGPAPHPHLPEARLGFPGRHR